MFIDMFIVHVLNVFVFKIVKAVCFYCALNSSGSSVAGLFLFLQKRSNSRKGSFYESDESYRFVV